LALAAVLGLAGSAAAGNSQALERAGARYPAGDRDGPRARVELGRGDGIPGFRLRVDGGEPHGRALLVLRRDGGGTATQQVALDEEGSGSVTWRGRSCDRECDAWFLLANKGRGKATTNQVSVPGAGALPGAATIMQRGDVLVTEFMKDPKSVSDTAGEWIELWNTTTRTVNIEGWWILDDGGDRHMLFNNAQGLYIPPRGYFVLGRKADPAVNGGVPVNYEYNGFSLSNGEDEIILVSRGDVLVDEVRYDDGIFWPDDPGKSIGLDPRRTGPQTNDDPNSWCHGQTPISATNPDLGTPGARNDLCP